MRRLVFGVGFAAFVVGFFLLGQCRITWAISESGAQMVAYSAATGDLPEAGRSGEFQASQSGEASLSDQPLPVLLTTDSDSSTDGRFYWKNRDAIREVLAGRKGIKLTVRCQVDRSTGHEAATSVRLFVPGGGVKLGPLTKDVHRAGYQDVIETGYQIGFSLVSDGKNHEQDEVLLMDFGHAGPHRVLARMPLPLNAQRTFTLEVQPIDDNDQDRQVVLSSDGTTPQSVTARLSDFGPNEDASDFGLVFGHLTGSGLAEARWQEVRLESSGDAATTSSVAPKPVIRDIGNQRQLLVDDWVIGESNGLTRRQGSPRKSDKNPVLRRDRPWEAARCELYGSSEWIPERGIVQLFYSAMSQPYDSRVAFAESKDRGVTWTKPELDQFAWQGKPTNVVWPGRYWSHGPCVLYDERETDPQKRYKLLTTAAAVNHEDLSEGPRGMDAAFSPDGIHWTAAANNPVIPDFVSDTGNCVIWDKDREAYRAYIRLRTNAGRAVGICESSDFLNWSEPRLIFWPSEDDRKENREFYGLSVTQYAGMYIGLVWIFPSVPASSDMQSDSPVTWLELAVSRDGEHWHRPFAGQPFLPLGAKGSFDSRQIRPASSMSVQPDRVLLMYSGSPHAHVSGHQWDIGAADVRIDGFAAMEAGSMEGELLTQPLSFPLGRLHVNVEVAKGGYVLAELCDDKGRALPGRTKELCHPLKSGALNAAIGWEGHDALETSVPDGTRVRFVLKNARLYSFWVEPSR
jgi:hypothetical protein